MNTLTDWLTLDNAFLGLGFLGAGITLAATILKNPRPVEPEKLPVWRAISILAGLSLAMVCFTLSLTHYRTGLKAMVDAGEKRYVNLLNRQHENTLGYIKNTAEQTANDVVEARKTLQGIYEVVHASSSGAWDSIAQRIVIPQLLSEDSTVPMIFFDKGTPPNWLPYRDWLFAAHDRGAQPALALELARGRMYVPGWILGWLLTTPETADIVEKQNQPGSPSWGHCADQPSGVFSEGRFPEMYVKYVLFFDGSSETRQLVAYADADAFARELKIQLDLGGCESVQAALNAEEANDSLQKLQNLLPSVRTTVLPAATVEEVADAMVKQQAQEAVLFGEGDRYYFVNLVQLFKPTDAKDAP